MVNPAASLVGVAIEEGARVVLINQGKTPYDDFVALQITAGIGDVLPRAVNLVKTNL